jgi:Sulfatase
MAVRLTDTTPSFKNENAIRKSACIRIAFVLLVIFSALLSITSLHKSNSSRRISDLGWDILVATTIMQQDRKDAFVAADAHPLNILILYPDDWRHDSLQDAQGGKVFTPFLTQLAKDGVRFTHNAVTSSICWISRATLFTGQYVSRHMAQRLFCPTFTQPEYWKDSWVSRLQKDKGYFVGHIGKWQYYNSKEFFVNAFNVRCESVVGRIESLSSLLSPSNVSVVPTLSPSKTPPSSGRSLSLCPTTVPLLVDQLARRVSLAASNAAFEQQRLE